MEKGDNVRRGSNSGAAAVREEDEVEVGDGEGGGGGGLSSSGVASPPPSSSRSRVWSRSELLVSASTNNPNSFCRRDVRSSRGFSNTGDRTEEGSTADVVEC